MRVFAVLVDFICLPEAPQQYSPLNPKYFIITHQASQFNYSRPGENVLSFYSRNLWLFQAFIFIRVYTYLKDTFVCVSCRFRQNRSDSRYFPNLQSHVWFPRAGGLKCVIRIDRGQWERWCNTPWRRRAIRATETFPLISHPGAVFVSPTSRNNKNKGLHFDFFPTEKTKYIFDQLILCERFSKTVVCTPTSWSST